MANGYFNHDDPVQPGTKVASAQFNNTMLAVQAGFDLLPTPQQFFYDNARFGVATSAGVNVYNLSLPQISSSFGYVLGMGILVKFPSTNTGPAQINVNGLGLKEMRTPFGQPLQAGDITPNVVYDMRYDGTYFQVLNAVDSAFTAINQYVVAAAASATAAAASATAAAGSATATANVLTNANTAYNALNAVVNSLPSIPQATASVLGTTKLSADYTVAGDAVTALTTSGGFGLYTILSGKAPTVHTHTWAQITGVPAASTTVAGIVQLDNTVTSSSTTLAATANVARMLQATADGKAPTVHTHTWSQILGVPTANLVQTGIVQLNDSVNSTSVTQAATANAVNQVNVALQGKAASVHTHDWSQINNVPTASTAAQGIVQLVDNLTSNSATQALTANQGVVIQGLLNGKAPTVHTHTWSQITGVPNATTSTAGIVQLIDSTTSTSTSLAPTANALYQVGQIATLQVQYTDVGATAVDGFCILALTTGTATLGSSHVAANLLLSDFTGTNRGAVPAGSTWTSCGFATGSGTASAARSTLFLRVS